MKATSRMFTLLLLSMFSLIGLSVVGSWEADRFMQPSAAGNSFATQANASYQRVRNWIAIVEGLSLLACAGLARSGFRLRSQARREESQRAALAR